MKQKKDNKQMLFEMMEKINPDYKKPSLKEDITSQRPKLGLIYKEGENYFWKNKQVFVDELKESLILEVMVPKIMETVAPEMDTQLSTTGDNLRGLPNFDDESSKMNTYDDMYQQSGGDESHEQLGEINNDIYKILNNNIIFSVVMEKSDDNQPVPVEHISGFNNAMKQIMNRFGINDVDLVIDLGRLLQHNYFIEMDN